MIKISKNKNTSSPIRKNIFINNQNYSANDNSNFFRISKLSSKENFNKYNYVKTGKNIQKSINDFSSILLCQDKKSYVSKPMTGFNSPRIENNCSSLEFFSPSQYQKTCHKNIINKLLNIKLNEIGKSHKNDKDGIFNFISDFEKYELNKIRKKNLIEKK